MGDAVRAAILATADSALRFHMEEAGVSAAVQQKIYSQGFCTLECFANLEESKSALQEVFAKDFGLDCSSDLAMRKEIALLLCVWERARTQLSYQERNRQDAKLGSQHRLLQTSEYSAMRAAVEKSMGGPFEPLIFR